MIPRVTHTHTQGHNRWVSFQDNWEAREHHALHREPEQDVLVVWLVKADLQLKCPPTPSPSALLKDELITHAARCYAQANFPVFQASDSHLTRLLTTTYPVCGVQLMSMPLFEDHVHVHHPALWMLGVSHLDATWPHWDEERLPCLWCLGTVNLAHGPARSQPHRCQMIAALALAQAYHAEELQPMSSIFDVSLPPSERIRWAQADNTSMAEALLMAEDPELCGAVVDSAAALGEELQRRAVGPLRVFTQSWRRMTRPASLSLSQC